MGKCLPKKDKTLLMKGIKEMEVTKNIMPDKCTNDEFGKYRIDR